ncbi:Dabb family protein [Paenarthrobacter nicotinovorans]|uniref:Dabb family protein n=1 Tax=Paenarthrobacter nicotinovorans TaxID=29320 RepID=UPI003826E898
MTEAPTPEAPRDAVITAPHYRPGVIKHIVLFQFRETTSQAQRQEIEDRFHALRTSTRGGQTYILSIESGPQNSPEGLHRGLEQGFIVTFGSEGDRNYYLGEPLITDPDCFDRAYHEFKQFVGPHLQPDGVLVFDFPVKRG